MRGGNQLGPLLRRLCLNGSPSSSSSSLAAISSSSFSESYSRSVVHTSSAINLVFSRHLVDSTSPCPGFVQSFSTLAEASPTSPPNFQAVDPGLQRIPFRRKGGLPSTRSRTNSAIASIVKLLVSCQTNEEVVALLEQRSEELLRPNSWPWLPLLDALQKGPKPHIAMEVFNWKKGKLGWGASPKEYAKMISFAGRISQPKLAADLFTEMEQRGIKKTAVSYNALIHSYGRNNEAHKALQLFTDMKATEDCQPTLVTYNTLISMFSRMGAAEDMQNLFADCKEAGFSPDRHTYNALIWGYMRSGQLDKMEEAFNELQDGDCQADVITFNAQIIGYARASAVEKMEHVFSKMQEASIPINAMVGEILIEVYSHRREFQKMEHIMSIMDDTPGVQYGSRVHSMVIESYAEAGKLDEMESAITRMFQNRRMFSTPKSLHALIQAYSKANEYDRLAKTMEVVKGAGWILQSGVLNVLISEYGKGVQIDRMNQTYQELVKANIKPSMETFQHMIDAYEAVGDEREVDRILDLMRDAGYNSKSPPRQPVDRMWTDDEIFGGKRR